MTHIAKKSLGQNFLKSQPALSMMVEAGEVESTDTILEIGPGKGALTAKLLEKAGKVIAIEKDRDLVAILKAKFVNEIVEKKLEIIEGDCLEFDPWTITPTPSLFEHSPSGRGRGTPSYKIIANIPYNITGAIMKRFLSEVPSPKTMVLLVQKEVAERIVARNKKESILSLSVRAFGTAHYMMKVGKRFFSPSPKVDSAIIAIVGISKSNFKTPDDEEIFFSVVKAAFAHRRKVMRTNLEDIASKEAIAEIFEELQIPDTARAEDLPFETFLKISQLLGR